MSTSGHQWDSKAQVTTLNKLLSKKGLKTKLYVKFFNLKLTLYIKMYVGEKNVFFITACVSTEYLSMN